MINHFNHGCEGGKWKAEATLTSLAEAFGRAMKQHGVESTMIIYDNISSAKVKEQQQQLLYSTTICLCYYYL